MKTLALAAAVACSLLAAEASAQSCNTLATQQIDWVRRGPGYFIEVTAMSLKSAPTTASSPVAKYFTGYMETYSPGFFFCWGGVCSTPIPSISTPAGASGTELSNQRLDSVTKASPVSYRWQPFSMFQLQSVGFSLAGNGSVTIQFRTTGGSATIASPTCNNGVLSGFGPDGTLYSLTFQQHYLG